MSYGGEKSGKLQFTKNILVRNFQIVTKPEWMKKRATFDIQIKCKCQQIGKHILKA